MSVASECDDANTTGKAVAYRILLNLDLKLSNNGSIDLSAKDIGDYSRGLSWLLRPVDFGDT